MEKEENKSSLIVLVIVLFILVLGLGGYIAYDKFLSDNSTNLNNNAQAPIVDNNTIEESNTNETIDENNNSINDTKDETTGKYFYDVNELNVKALPEYRIFTDISNNTNVVETLYFDNERNHVVTLDLSGNVTVLKYGSEGVITGKLNVNGVIDIVHFNVPGMGTEQLLYLLTYDGSVYYYRIGDIEKNSFSSTKVESVSNVKKIFISNFSKTNAGGSWALFAITGNHDCIMIKGESV